MKRERKTTSSFGAVGRTLLLLCACASSAAAQQQSALPEGLPAGFKAYESPIYHVYTDVDLDMAREAVIRMNKIALAYHDRTAAFSGAIREKLPFYLFKNSADYVAAGGLENSAGVFTGDSLKATVIRDSEGRVDRFTWHVVQHEGFHQFVHAVIRGDIPTWTNEGLAEYFGEGIFTGDGIVTGAIPPQRLQRIKKEIEENRYKPFPKIMFLDQAAWNQELGSDESSAGVNYDQAWSMVHFLAHAENGKYQRPFMAFMFDVGRGQPWGRAWLANVGPADGFEQQWKNYWSKLPENPTADVYAKAATATLTSFLGRAYSQKQTFASFDELIATDVKSMKFAEADWLPPGLFTDVQASVRERTEEGAVFSITTEQPHSKLPQITCLLPDGTKLIGRFTLHGGRIGQVQVDTMPPPAKKKK